MEYSAKAQSLIDATKVDYRQVGESGLRVSVPILGTMGFGQTEGNPMKWVLPEEKALPLLKAAWDCGVNTWDTANNYSNGSSEIVIGKAIKHYDIPRHKIILMTKCWALVGETMDIPGFFPPVGPKMESIKNTPHYVNHNGLSRQAIFNQVNASLSRLQTDYIDLLQIHKADPEVPMEETMKALHDLVSIGKVRYIGASSMRGVEFAMMQFVAEKNGWTKFVSMQNQYNLLYREEEREMNFFCNATGVGLIPYSPLCRGHLARPPSEHRESVRGGIEFARGAMRATGYSEEDQLIISRVEEIAKKKGWSMSDVSLAWINKRVSSPIVGFSTVKRMEDTLTVRGKILTEEEERYLEEPYVPKTLTF